MTIINTILTIFLCSLSDYAFSCDCKDFHSLPPPIKRFSEKKMREFEKEKDLLKIKAKEDWNNEIEILRREKQ